MWCILFAWLITRASSCYSQSFTQTATCKQTAPFIFCWLTDPRGEGFWSKLSMRHIHHAAHHFSPVQGVCNGEGRSCNSTRNYWNKLIIRTNTGLGDLDKSYLTKKKLCWFPLTSKFYTVINKQQKCSPKMTRQIRILHQTSESQTFSLNDEQKKRKKIICEELLHDHADKFTLLLS